jgi:phage baseplate assembly protein W
MFLKQSTAYTFRMGPFLDETDGKTAETGLTISQADVRLSKGGGNFAQKNESTSASHDEIGYYIVLLDATDTATVGELLVAVHESGALPVFKTFQVVEEAIYDAIYGASADLVTKVDAIDTVVDAILVDTGTTLDGKINTIDTVVDSILVDTAVIGSAGAGLTGVPWNAAWDAEVQSEVADGLAAYDPPTKAELDSAFTEIKGGSWASTDTLEAIRDRGDAAWTTGGGGSAPSAAAIADAVWDEATSGHTSSGTFGEQVKTDIDAILVDTGTTLDGKIDTIDGIVDSILVDTGTTLNDKIDVIDGIVDSILVDTGTTLDGKLDTIDNFLDTEIAAILADTNELQTDWANGGRLDALLDSAIAKIDVVDGVVDAILVDTAVIGSAGAGLSGVPWNAAWDAEVQSEVADALAAYDPPTKAEMDAMWTTAATESYASDGAAATPAQLLYMILCAVSEFSISSTTITGKKVDGSTTAMTWTLDDASSPTSRTRAS